MKSGSSEISSMAFNTSPAINSQFVIPFLFTFSRAASTASSTISTPITFPAETDRICAIVPVPLYKSNTTELFPADAEIESPINSRTVSYSVSAPREFVWKKENGVILNFNPSNSS